MNQFTLFAGISATIITPVMAQLQAMIGAVCATMQPIVLLMITVWLCFVGFDIANGTKSGQAAMKDFFIAAMVVGLLQVGQYTQYVSGFFLTAVPNTVNAALGGGASPIAILDTVLNTAVAATFKVYEALPNFSLKTVAITLVILGFLVLDALAIAYTFAIFMIASIINVLVVLVGPVFLALGATPFTRKYAAGWVAALVSGCTTQLMALAAISLISGAEVTMIQQMMTTAASSNSNTIAMFWALIQAFIVMMLGAAVVAKIPHIAQSIAGGIYHGSQGAHASTLGLAAVAAVAAAAGARGAVGATGKAAAGRMQNGSFPSKRPGLDMAGMRTNPPGRSLSGGP
jgi:type IV secretory pathway VirB6-like protein